MMTAALRVLLLVSLVFFSLIWLFCCGGGFFCFLFFGWLVLLLFCLGSLCSQGCWLIPEHWDAGPIVLTGYTRA